MAGEVGVILQAYCVNEKAAELTSVEKKHTVIAWFPSFKELGSCRIQAKRLKVRLGSNDSKKLPSTTLALNKVEEEQTRSVYFIFIPKHC